MPEPPKKPVNYAALARAAAKQSASAPDWLAVSRQIHAPKHAEGIGKVTAILGDRALAKFPGYSVPVLISNWQQAILSCKAIFLNQRSPALYEILFAIAAIEDFFARLPLYFLNLMIFKFKGMLLWDCCDGLLGFLSIS